MIHTVSLADLRMLMIRAPRTLGFLPNGHFVRSLSRSLHSNELRYWRLRSSRRTKRRPGERYVGHLLILVVQVTLSTQHE